MVKTKNFKKTNKISCCRLHKLSNKSKPIENTKGGGRQYRSKQPHRGFKRVEARVQPNIYYSGSAIKILKHTVVRMLQIFFTFIVFCLFLIFCSISCRYNDDKTTSMFSLQSTQCQNYTELRSVKIYSQQYLVISPLSNDFCSH